MTIYFTSKCVPLQLLDQDATCASNYIEFTSGSMVEKFCGTELPKHFMSFTNEMTVVFNTDGKFRRPNFTATYQKCESTSCNQKF